MLPATNASGLAHAPAAITAQFCPTVNFLGSLALHNFQSVPARFLGNFAGVGDGVWLALFFNLGLFTGVGLAKPIEDFC